MKKNYIKLSIFILAFCFVLQSQVFNNIFNNAIKTNNTTKISEQTVAPNNDTQNNSNLQQKSENIPTSPTQLNSATKIQIATNQATNSIIEKINQPASLEQTDKVYDRLKVNLKQSSEQAVQSENIGTQGKEEFVENVDLHYNALSINSYPTTITTKLTSTQFNSLYNTIKTGLANYNSEIYVSTYSIDKNDIMFYYTAIIFDNPELVYVDASISYYYNSSNKITRIIPKYWINQSEYTSKMNLVNDKANEIIANYTNSNMSTAEKLFSIHNYLVLNSEYDIVNYNNNTIPDSSFTAYGTLINKISVCQGYALSFGLLANKLGIDWFLVQSDLMTHAWNMFKIDGQWYHIDATWNDPLYVDPIADGLGSVDKDYLFCSDQIISDSNHQHTGWENYGYTATDNSYESSWFKNISQYQKYAAPIYKDGFWYYLDSNGINKIKFDGTQKSTVFSKTGLSLLAPFSSKLYYSTTNEVYSINFDGTSNTLMKSVTVKAGTAISEMWTTEPNALTLKYTNTLGQYIDVKITDELYQPRQTLNYLIITLNQTTNIYTTSSWSTFVTKISTAQSVYNNTDSTLSQINEQITILQSASSLLELKGDKTLLQPIIDQAKLKQQADYTPAQWSTLQTAITSAEQLVQGSEEVSLNTINNKIIELKTAMNLYRLGDVNNDQKIDGKDIAAIVMHITKVKALIDSEAYKAYSASDINKDSKIDGKDIAAIVMNITKIKLIV